MLTTNQRTTQTLDPTTGAARADLAPVTAPAYPVCATRLRAASASARRRSTTTGLTTANPWSSIGLDVMPKVDFHDRWPLRSPS